MVQVLDQNVRRHSRNPSHTFQLRHKPYVLQPFMIAPVLAGETLVSANLQARAVTQPILNPVIGWHLEFDLFYVKVTDLVSMGASGTVHWSDDIQNLILRGTPPAANLVRTTTQTQYYTADGSLDYISVCMERIINAYFRAGDENYWTAAGREGGQYAMCHAQVPGWLDSVGPWSAFDVPAQDIPVEGPDADSVIEASEVDRALQRWRLMAMQGLTTQTWPEYLAEFGVHGEALDMHEPEHLRRLKYWQYPSNTIDPVSGSPSSAVSWSVAEAVSKRRYFSEPGWIVGLTFVKPKTYSKVQVGNMAGFMNDQYKWLPPQLWNDPRASYSQYSDVADSPLDPAVVTTPFAADTRDLLEFGDQFVNFALDSAGGNFISLPSGDLSNKRYATSADIAALFKTAGQEYCWQDGVCSLHIATALPKGFSPSELGVGQQYPLV